jgi:hypothetical protein
MRPVATHVKTPQEIRSLSSSWGMWGCKIPRIEFWKRTPSAENGCYTMWTQAVRAAYIAAVFPDFMSYARHQPARVSTALLLSSLNSLTIGSHVVIKYIRGLSRSSLPSWKQREYQGFETTRFRHYEERHTYIC